MRKATLKVMPARGRPRKTPKATLKAVAIPPTRFNVSSSGGRRVSPSQSSETNSSGLSSLGDQLSDHETPETSAIMTPAESLIRREHWSTVLNQTPESNDDTQTSKMGVSIKRKRAHMDDDALLAQTLQEEEYQMDESGQGLVKRQRTIKSENSLDLPSLSDRIEALLPEQERRTHSSKSLRTRGAWASDRKSTSTDVAREVMDTESDGSELSEYVAREDMDDHSESEINISGDDSEPVAIVNARSSSIHGGRGRGRASLQNGNHRYQRQRAVNPPAPRYGAAESWRSRRMSRVSWHEPVSRLD